MKVRSSNAEVRSKFSNFTSYFKLRTSNFPYGGDLDSTEMLFRRMRAEDHPPRQQMETKVTADTQYALAA